MSSGCLASHNTARKVIMVLVRKYLLDLSYYWRTNSICGLPFPWTCRASAMVLSAVWNWKCTLRPLFSFLNARAAGDDLRHSTRHEFAWNTFSPAIQASSVSKLLAQVFMDIHCTTVWWFVIDSHDKLQIPPIPCHVPWSFSLTCAPPSICCTCSELTPILRWCLSGFIDLILYTEPTQPRRTD